LTFISSTGGKAGSMESINLFRGGSSEADSHPVSGRCFTVARTGNDKCRLFAAIEYPAVAKRAEVIDTKRAQDDIVKCGGFSTSAAPMNT
jgi:hypothetical protein